MKVVTLVVLLAVTVAMASAEPPRRRARPLWGARLEAEPPAPAEPPYPPSGWRPAKPFYLPGEYGGPEQGEATTEEEPATTTETTTAAAEEEATTTAAPEGDNDGAEARDNEAEYEDEPEPASANLPAGVYYVLLPDGRLQRVNYQVAVPGPVSGSYVVQDVGPFNSPIYTYPSASLIQILKK